ncbi:DEAD/DEAH box helicase [Nostoc sp.]|uniref:DEAD/DEAH box helicase n=1 Tax=Nostoc sp. TaxID=1180 RepID=UPI002FF83C56
MDIEFKQGNSVSHPKHGNGQVRTDEGTTVIVRFEHGLEECPREELARLSSLQEAINSLKSHNSLEVIARVQALAIRSVNDVWGIFSLARIALLPHQLWVCRRVVQELPVRCLVADDVGLGKTIEAGLILWTLLSKGAVKRILIVCPASLVEQWQHRLRVMFDIRCTRYITEADTSKSDFWNTHHQVIASLPTLRKNSGDRHKRLFDAEPWDLLIVDEAHHLNADEQSGPTLGYSFIDKLVNRYKKVRSVVFFSGTPHRGKNYEFFSLLKLLREDLFHPKKLLKEQLQSLRSVMIRNNKQSVTDMKGNKLFLPLQVRSEIYDYSPEESLFYEQLTEFILTGKAYASGLDDFNQRAVMLILICMQKLASSSVAAIRRALEGRLRRIDNNRKQLDKVKQRKREVEQEFNDLEDEEKLNSDEINRLEERILELTEMIRLMEDEEPRLRELVQAASAIREETKIQKILDVVANQFTDRQVLFFTEYKATQSLLMSALIARYGDQCVTFINGDELAEGVISASNQFISLREKRENAAEKFNKGEVRFLISTEAGGEGIDLQENCYSLIHVDLPWNPMRLHQRVGRLNRYGQKRAVEVITLRNPQTVETLIWDKLNRKIDNIMQSLQQVMDEPEDLLQLVLGMTSPKLFREIFSDADRHHEDLNQWFDSKTAKFGGKDAIATVQEIVGSCDKFDFQQVSPLLPQLDLPDLQSFFLTMLQLNKRRIKFTDEGFSFITPDTWRTESAIQREYEEVHFNRYRGDKNPAHHLLGVGHKLFNAALSEATSFTACVTVLPCVKQPLFIFLIIDRVTGIQSNVRQAVVGISIDLSKQATIVKDWELIATLNQYLPELKKISESSNACLLNANEISRLLANAEQFLENNLNSLNLPFKVPTIQAISVILPAKEAI